MNVEMHINGSNQVILKPEKATERTILREMADAAGKGKAVRLDAVWDHDAVDDGERLVSVTVSVEA